MDIFWIFGRKISFSERNQNHGSCPSFLSSHIIIPRWLISPLLYHPIEINVVIVPQTIIGAFSRTASEVF
jgi:hypothetical protein